MLELVVSNLDEARALKEALRHEPGIRTRPRIFAGSTQEAGLANLEANGASAGTALTEPLRGPAAARAASRRGYPTRVSDPPFNPHGQAVFTNGRTYITPDIDKHRGGVWKLFDRAGKRLGTYDWTLKEKIGP